MWLFVNEDIANKYNDVYESIIRDTYQFTCFYDRKFKKLIPSESEFIKVCLSMECRNCTFEDILNYVNRNGNKISNDLGGLLLPQFIYTDIDVHKEMSDYLENRFKDNHELLLATLIYLIEINDNTSNVFTRILRQLSYLKNYEKFFFFLNIFQANYAVKMNMSSFEFNKNQMYKEYICVLDFIEKYIKEKKINKLIQMNEDYFKYFFLLDLSSIKYIKNKKKDRILFIMNYFNTFNWVKDKKNLLQLLSEAGIFYQDFIDYLNEEERNEYLSKMVLKDISCESYIF